MKKNKKRIAAWILLGTLCITGITGCGNKKEKTEKTENTEKVNTEEITGTITMAGSTSMEKFATALSEAFMGLNNKITINSEYIGSSAGVEALIAGSADIGNSSRALKDTEIAAGVVENKVAIDGIAVIVNKNNTITNLTKEDLAKIYKGEVRNWSELGGSDMPVVVVGREAGSGTRGAFEELLAVEEQCAYANELDSTGAVMAKVASTKGAIGYVSLDVLDDSVTAVNLEGVAPTAEEIKAGNYFLSRHFVMATMGEISDQTPQIQELFHYLKTEEGKALIESVGLINID
ncbi:MAG: phosphate ABC transporter substrate-binding protein [Acetivibrio sp.]